MKLREILTAKKVAVASGAVLGLSQGVASAATSYIPAAATTAFSDLQSDVTTIIGLIWPILISVTVAFVIMGLFKKGTNKAVS